MLGLNETIDQLANSVRCYGHVLRREDGHLLRRALDLKVDGQRKKGRSKEEREVKGRKGGQRKKGRSKRIWKRSVEEENMKVGLRSEDAPCRSRWSFGVNKIAEWLR